MFRITAFAGASLCLIIAGLGPAVGGNLHPRCNIDWPCVGASDHRVKTGNVSKRESRRIARGQRIEQAMPFGSAIVKPETQRSFLGRSSGLVDPLASKLASIQSACPGTVAISGVRHTRIAGTRRMSLHAEGKAVDVTGPYGCIYAELRGWQGGYSTDAGRMRHIHISYDAQGGREMGLAFRHGGGRKYARRAHRHRIANAER